MNKTIYDICKESEASRHIKCKMIQALPKMRGITHWSKWRRIGIFGDCVEKLGMTYVDSHGYGSY